MAESAVQFFAPDHPQLARTLVQHLRQAYQKYAAELVEGFCADYPEYRQAVGRLDGIRRAIDICEQLEKELSR